MQPFQFKARIIDVLTIEKVVYGMEIARRIDVYRARTIKFVLKEMFKNGEVECSGVNRINGNVKIEFWWLPGTDQYTIDRVCEFKIHLLLDHLEYSSVQENFGPKLAKASLRELATKNIFPLSLNSIEGPISKWKGPNKMWSGNEVVISHGDLDFIGLETNGRNLWLGEVKMRADVLKKVQAEHFFSTAINFRQKIFDMKGIHFRLKLFILTPITSDSARKYCKKKHIELVECDIAYYPTGTSKKKDLMRFYEVYKSTMGVPNLQTISPSSLPVSKITDRFYLKPFRHTI